MGAGLGTALQGPAKEDHLPAPGRLLPAGLGSKGPGWVPGGGSGRAVTAHVTCVQTWRLGWGLRGGLHTQAPGLMTLGSPDGFGGIFQCPQIGGGQQCI